MDFYDLVDAAAKLDYVKHVSVSNDGVFRGMEIRLGSNHAVNASQALEDPALVSGMALASGGQQSDGTYKILAIGPNDKQTRDSSITPEGQATKGGLSPEDVLEAVESMHKETAHIPQ